MGKFEKIMAFFVAISLIFGLYRYKVFNDNKYKKILGTATNSIYSLYRIQKSIYDDYNEVYRDAIEKKCSFYDLYSNKSHERIKSSNARRIKVLNDHSFDKLLLQKLENPRLKYKSEYNLLLDAYDYYNKNLNKFNLDPNSFKESDYDEFIKHFNELNTKLANLMKTLEMPEYDAYFN